MRALLASLALASLLLAQEPVRTHDGPVFRDGKLRDSFWGLTYQAPGLKKSMSFGDFQELFRGKCDGGVKVSIRVHESLEPKAAKAWRDEALAGWKKAGRKLTQVERGESGEDPDTWILVTQTGMAGFESRHGHAFHARDFHCFEVHAEVEERTDESDAAIRKALAGLELAKEADGTLLVARLARQAGRHLDDPQLLLSAGYEYISGQNFGQTHTALAARVLKRARRIATQETYTPEERWALYEFGGGALLSPPLRKAEEAMEWLRQAEKAAKAVPQGTAERAAQSAYNLACACSLAGKLDEGFAALRRAYAEIKPVVDEHVSSDKDLENLRKDERWHAFWKDCVKAK
jgi:hypothetical protein